MQRKVVKKRFRRYVYQVRIMKIRLQNSLSVRKRYLNLWRKNAKIERFYRRNTLTHTLFTFSAWKYAVRSVPGRKLVKGKKTAFLQHFQRLQILRSWKQYISARIKEKNAVKLLSASRLKRIYTGIRRVYFSIKEKRLAQLSAEKERKQSLQQEAHRLKLASEYYNRRLLLQCWKTLRVAHTRSHNVSQELPVLSDSSIHPVTPSVTAKKIQKRLNFSFEDEDLKPSKERHIRISSIIASSVRSHYSENSAEKEHIDTSAPVELTQQLVTNLVSTEPALAKAQTFIDQLNALLRETKQSGGL